MGELWAPHMALPLSQLSEQAHALWRIWIVHDSFRVFFLLRAIVLWRVWSFIVSRCSISHASLGSQCCLHIVRGVLIALRANAECEYFVPNARRPALGTKTYEQVHAEFVSVIFIFWLTIVLWHVGSFTGSPCSFRSLLRALNALLIL